MQPFLTSQDKVFSLPNCVTYIRLAFLPLLVYWYVNDHSWAAVILFILMALSDYFDGYLARLLSIKSNFGAWLDQLADKIFVLVVIAALLFQGAVELWAYPAVILIVLREVSVGLQRWHPCLISAKPVGFIGKVKTTVQMLSLLLFFLPADQLGFLNRPLFDSSPLLALIANLMLWISALLALKSLLDYRKQNR